MLKSDLHPPHTGLDADPVLFGVAACLAELFPPIASHAPATLRREQQAEGDDERELRDRD